MRTRAWAAVAAVSALVILIGAIGSAGAGDAKAAYPSMADIGQYKVPSPADEVALARSAAPTSIAGDAGVLILGSHGYETAAKGKNGFVCLVERSWAAGFSDSEFWNPEASRTDMSQPRRCAQRSSRLSRKNRVGAGRRFKVRHDRSHQGRACGKFLRHAGGRCIGLHAVKAGIPV